MLSPEFMAEFIQTDSRLVDLQRTFKSAGRDVFERHFVYGQSDHPLGYVPADLEARLTSIGCKSELIKNSKRVARHVGRFYAQHEDISLQG